MDKYAFDKDTGIYSLSLRCVWQDFSTEVFLIFLTEMGHIKILLKKNFGRIDFMIKADESNSSYLTAFKSCTARMPNKQHLYFGGVKLQNSSRPQFGSFRSYTAATVSAPSATSSSSISIAQKYLGKGV
ncbi:hypothetical protein BGZ93_000575 [Podila epicladia]|nr:hypothetical protein BGZ93_000575 [Podila epicladia]